MTTATAQQQTARPIFGTNAAPQQPAADAAMPMGRYYVQNAAPIKGAVPASDGRCFFLLKCFPVDEKATYGEVTYRTYHPSEAVYIPYYGLIAGNKNDKGLMVGYVYDCKGTDSLRVAVEGMEGPTMTEGRFYMVTPPKTEYVRDFPYYGPHTDNIQGIDETIATLNAIDAIVNPKPQPRMRRPSCIGG